MTSLNLNTRVDFEEGDIGLAGGAGSEVLGSKMVANWGGWLLSTCVFFQKIESRKLRVERLKGWQLCMFCSFSFGFPTGRIKTSRRYQDLWACACASHCEGRQTITAVTGLGDRVDHCWKWLFMLNSLSKTMVYWLVVWNIFHFPYIGNNHPNWIQLTNIFQRGWNNRPAWFRCGFTHFFGIRWMGYDNIYIIYIYIYDIYIIYIIYIYMISVLYYDNPWYITALSFSESLSYQIFDNYFI